MLPRLVLNSRAEAILPGSSDCPLFSLPNSWDYRNALPRPADFVFLVEMGFCHVGQAGLKILTSGDPPASVSQSAGITGISHHARPVLTTFKVTEEEAEAWNMPTAMQLTSSRASNWTINKHRQPGSRASSPPLHHAASSSLCRG